MAKARKNKTDESEVHQPPTNDQAPFQVDDLASSAEFTGETGPGRRQWAKAPNPFPSIGYYWPDYEIQYQENVERNRVGIKFGDGTKAAIPLNFEKIKPLLLANGLRWDAKDRAWTLALEWQVKNSEEGAAQTNEQIRRQNAKIRGQIEELLPELVKLEEEVRGPATGRSQKPPKAAR